MIKKNIILIFIVLLFCNCSVAKTPSHKNVQSSKKQANYIYYFNKATNESKMGNYDNAIINFTKAIEYNNKCADCYACRGIIKRGVFKNYQGAISDLSKAISLDSRNYEYYMERGRTRAWVEDYSGTISDLSIALTLNPKSGDSYFLRSVTRNHLQDYTGAMQDADIAKELFLQQNNNDKYMLTVKWINRLKDDGY